MLSQVRQGFGHLPKEEQNLKKDFVKKEINIGQDQAINGDFIVHDAILTVSGRINGDLIAYRSDVILKDSAVITGKVIIHNGSLKKESGAKTGDILEISSKRTPPPFLNVKPIFGKNFEGGVVLDFRTLINSFEAKIFFSVLIFLMCFIYFLFFKRVVIEKYNYVYKFSLKAICFSLFIFLSIPSIFWFSREEPILAIIFLAIMSVLSVPGITFFTFSIFKNLFHLVLKKDVPYLLYVLFSCLFLSLTILIFSGSLFYLIWLSLGLSYSILLYKNS
ncbi:bactofilin family protein [Thermodesulfobium narugense]|nr:polymer-forming cytoskeletal protein [Thermodesulfobium narugense]